MCLAQFSGSQLLSSADDAANAMAACMSSVVSVRTEVYSSPGAVVVMKSRAENMLLKILNFFCAPASSLIRFVLYV